MYSELNFQNPMGAFKIFLLLSVACVHAEVDPMGDNVCLKSESYNVEQIVSKSYPYTTNSVQWCWSLKKFFRCTTSKTEWKIVQEPKIVTKTKLVAKCCTGYQEKYTKCVPVCTYGCGPGTCIAPEKCDCPAGLYGLFCKIPCPENRWGKNCIEECICLNGGVCDKISGTCNCTAEWQGQRCELPTARQTTIKPMPATTAEARKMSFEEEKNFKEKVSTQFQNVTIIWGVKDIIKTTTEDIETAVEEVLKQLENEDINRAIENVHETATEVKEEILKKDKNEERNSGIDVNESVIEDEKIVVKEGVKESENKDFNWAVNSFEEMTTETEKGNVEMLKNKKIGGLVESDIETTTESKGEEIMNKVENEDNIRITDNVEGETAVAEENVFEEESSTSTETSKKSNEAQEPLIRNTKLRETSGTSTSYIDTDDTIKLTTNDSTTIRGVELANSEILILMNNSKDIDWKSENDIEVESDSLLEHQKKTAKLVYFIPSLTVLSGVSMLIFLIVGRWWLVSHKKKLKKIQMEKEGKKFRAEWQRKDSTDDTFIVNNFEGNPSYIPDIDIHVSVPVLQTFKPLDSGIMKKPQS